MRPKRRSHMPGVTRCTNISGPISVFCSDSEKSFSAISWKNFGAGPSPFNKMMSGSGQASSRSNCVFSVDESPTTALAEMPYFAASSLAVSCTSFSVRPLMTTLTPSRARLSAHALPRPRLDARRMAWRLRIPRSITTPKSVRELRGQPQFQASRVG